MWLEGLGILNYQGAQGLDICGCRCCGKKKKGRKELSIRLGILNLGVRRSCA